MTTSVSTAFDILLAEQRLTDTQEAIAKGRIAGLSDFFLNHFMMEETPFTIGSYARGTVCRGERDIDMMAPFSTSEYWNRFQGNSSEFLYWVRNYLNDRYETTKVSSRQVAVTLDFTTIAVDIVPCFSLPGGGYLMPNGSGRWQATNPPYHTSLMADANLVQGYELRPLVKLIKAWNIANSHHLSSFHVELMVERIKRGHNIGAWSAEVAMVLKELSSLVNSTFPDPWPGGVSVDSYLSWDKRQAVSRLLEGDAKRAADAEEYRLAGYTESAFERWRVVYRDEFPAYG